MMTFDLETAITAWRKECLRHPGIDPSLMEELEAHLRDALDEDLENGEDAEKAFKAHSYRITETLDELARDYHTARAVTSRPPHWDNRVGALAMFARHFRTAGRKLTKRRGYAALNTAGLAVAMAAVFLSALFVLNELSFDTFHPDHERIYRVSTTTNGPDGPVTTSRSPGTLAPFLDEADARVEHSVRIIDLGNQSIRRGDASLQVNGAMFVDSTFFQVFGFDLLVGNPWALLRSDNSTVLTSSTAKRFFGDEDPVGQVLTLGMGGFDLDFTVEGLVADPPAESHIQFDILFPFAYWDTAPPERRFGFDSWIMNWENNRVITYVKTASVQDVRMLNAGVNDLVGRQLSSDLAERLSFGVENITDIHLRSSLPNELSDVDGNMRYVILMSVIGIMMLLIAIFNFINLSTAHASERAVETGLRKTLGAQRSELVSQFLTESVLLASVASLLAAVLALSFMPVFSDLVDKSFTPALDGQWVLWLLFPALALIVGLLAGAYPSMVLSSALPSSVLKSSGGTSTKRSSLLRNTLVISQFAAAAILLASMFVVNRQMDLFQEKELGFGKEQVLTVPIDGSDLGDRVNILRQRLENVQGVQTSALASWLPGHSLGEETNAFPFRTEGMGPDDQPLMWDIMPAGHGFIETMGMELVSGRFFDRDIPSDSTRSFVINESAVRAMGWEEPIGQRLEWYMPGPGGFSLQQSGEVIGVVEDFHAYSLHRDIGPIVMMIPNLPWQNSLVVLKAYPQFMSSTVANLQDEWNALMPNAQFEVRFLDQEYEQLYRSEERMARIFGIMATLALFVACLGLIGLSSYVTKQRTREIGIRKVLGADVKGIVFQLMRSFLGLVIIGTVIAIPIVVVTMGRWLDRFAYRVSFSPGEFIATGLTVLFIAAAVVSYHSIKASLTNPVDSLRSD